MLCYSECTYHVDTLSAKEGNALLWFHFTPKCWYKSCFEVLKATFNHFPTWWTVKMHTERISIDISTVKVRRAIPSCLSRSWSYLGTFAHAQMELRKGFLQRVLVRISFWPRYLSIFPFEETIRRQVASVFFKQRLSLLSLISAQILSNHFNFWLGHFILHFHHDELVMITIAWLTQKWHFLIWKAINCPNVSYQLQNFLTWLKPPIHVIPCVPWGYVVPLGSRTTSDSQFGLPLESWGDFGKDIDRWWHSCAFPLRLKNFGTKTRCFFQVCTFIKTINQ